jgi:hypothetical protein
MAPADLPRAAAPSACFRPKTQGLSPFVIRACARINLTSGRRRRGCTIIPPAAAKAQEDETILDDGV